MSTNSDGQPSQSVSPIDILIKNIQSHPQLSELLKEAGERAGYIPEKYKPLFSDEKTTQKKPNFIADNLLSKWSSKLARFLIVNPKELSAGTYLSPHSSNAAKLTAGVTTTSNWIDFLGNTPVLYYAFNFFPGAGIIGIVMSGLILKFSNEISVAAAGGKWAGLIWSNFAIAGLLLINVVQSATTMAGVELFNNRSRLVRDYGREILERVIKEKQDVYVVDTSISKACLDLEKKADEAYIEAESVPDFEPALSQYENAASAYKKCLERVEILTGDPIVRDLENASSSGDYLTALYQYTPVEYHANFTNAKDSENNILAEHHKNVLAGDEILSVKDEGSEIQPPAIIVDANFKNGYDAASQAIKKTSGKIKSFLSFASGDAFSQREDIVDIGFSGYIFLISSITSLSSVLLIVAFSMLRIEGGGLRSRLGGKANTKKKSVPWTERTVKLNLLWSQLLSKQEKDLKTVSSRVDKEALERDQLFERIMFNLFRDAAERTGDYDYLIPEL